MRVLGIIPARGGSKGVPGKNKKLLGGKPLITYTIAHARNSELLTDIIISTDDTEIQEIGLSYGIDVPFLRPSDLASDTSKSIDVVQHAIAFLDSKNKAYDAICLLQPTVPFRTKGTIDQAITKFKSQQLDSLISVREVPHQYNPHWVFEAVDGHLKLSTGEQEIIARRQDLPPAFYRDGSIYLTSVEVVKKGTFYGNKMGYILSNSKNHVNIDTLEDWHKAEAYQKK